MNFSNLSLMEYFNILILGRELNKFIFIMVVFKDLLLKTDLIFHFI